MSNTTSSQSSTMLMLGVPNWNVLVNGAWMQGENSEVFPAGSVAVAVKNLPPLNPSKGPTVLLNLPLESVVIVPKPANFSPSPLPEGSQVELVKKLMTNFVLGVLLSE